MNTPLTHICLRFSILALLGALLFAVTASAFAAADGCTAPDWDVGEQYNRGDVVNYDYHEWKAKRNTLGVEPGTHKPTWQDLGACAMAPPPPPPPPDGAGAMEIFGVWHAGNHYADWALERDASEDGEFDLANRWIIDRGDGTPSVNLVVLSFLHPTKVLNRTNDEVTVDGVPIGMSQEVVDYFKNRGIRVMMSIGGVTYTDYWDEAIATEESATQLGFNAAAIAEEYGVGIEIDYERNVGANLPGLQAFINEYRRIHPYDPTGNFPERRLTIDLAAGGRYLQELNRYATEQWLNNDNPVLDYANAMVARSSGTPENWQEHIDGKLHYDPPIPPKAPNRLTAGLYLKGNIANCYDFYSSEQWQWADYVQNVLPNGAGATPGLLGYMFWAAEYPSARKNYVGTVPPNSCKGGMGTAMEVFKVEVPMPELRQE
jgi:opacity protein-like surface antigen